MVRALEQMRLQAADWGIQLHRSQVSLLAEYADILAGYQQANVIGTKNWDTIVIEHLTDALSCLTVEALSRKASLVDVGTGGGLPGIPLAIACPELSVALLEATEKKTRFLNVACETLGLWNTEVLHARAEAIGRTPRYRDVFGVATARALGALPVVAEFCAPLVRTGGTIIAMKGRLSEEELCAGAEASPEVGAALREVRRVKYRAPLREKERQLVVFDKVRPTPDKFPRRVGVVKKRPLGTRTGSSAHKQDK